MVAQAKRPGTPQYPPTNWLREARLRRIPVQPVVYDNGLNQLINRDLPNVGYNQRLRIVQSVALTHSVAPSSLDAFGLYAGLINRFVLKPQGIAFLMDVSGEALGLISMLDNLAKNRAGGSFSAPGFTAPVAAPGTSATAFKITHDVPIALEGVMNYHSPIGLYQNAVIPTELSAQFFFRPINGTNGVTNPGNGVWVPGVADSPTGITTSITLELDYYETIPNPRGWPVGNLAHTWREIKVYPTADGVVRIPFQPNKKVVRAIYWLVTGASNALAPDSTHMTNLALKYGGSDTIYDETADQVTARQARIYNTALPAGVYIHDFLSESDTDRDWFDTSLVPDPRAEMTLSGATYSGGAYIKAIFEEVSRVVPSGAAPRP